MSQTEHKPGKKPSQEARKSNPNEVLKYSGMAFQMAFLTFIGVFIGQKLDSYFGMEKPVMTLIGAILFITLAFYVSLKDLIFPKK